MYRLVYPWVINIELETINTVCGLQKVIISLILPIPRGFSFQIESKLRNTFYNYMIGHRTT